MPTNFISISGNMTRDPELRTVGAKGTSVTMLGIAWSDKRGERENTVFVDVQVWGRQAEEIAKYHKGTPIMVFGELRMDTWDDAKTGQKRSKLFINADSVAPIALAPKQDAVGLPPTPTSARVPRPAPSPSKDEDSVPF